MHRTWGQVFYFVIRPKMFNIKSGAKVWKIRMPIFQKHIMIKSIIFIYPVTELLLLPENYECTPIERELPIIDTSFKQKYKNTFKENLNFYTAQSYYSHFTQILLQKFCISKFNFYPILNFHCSPKTM